MHTFPRAYLLSRKSEELLLGFTHCCCPLTVGSYLAIYCDGWEKFSFVVNVVVVDTLSRRRRRVSLSSGSVPSVPLPRNVVTLSSPFVVLVSTDRRQRTPAHARKLGVPRSTTWFSVTAPLLRSVFFNAFEITKEILGSVMLSCSLLLAAWFSRMSWWLGIFIFRCFCASAFLLVVVRSQLIFIYFLFSLDNSPFHLFVGSFSVSSEIGKTKKRGNVQLPNGNSVLLGGYSRRNFIH